MCTSRIMTMPWRQIAVVLGGLIVIFRASVLWAAIDLKLEQDLALDLDLNVLEAPVVQPLGIPGSERGLPRWPIYKQEPPAAQGDFSLPAIAPGPADPKPSPGPKPKPSPGPKPKPSPDPKPPSPPPDEGPPDPPPCVPGPDQFCF